ALSSMIWKAEIRGHIQGVVVSRLGPRVSQLLFADDTMIFCQAIGKSGTVFNKNMDNTTWVDLAQILGVAVIQKHEKYLKFPMVVGRSKREDVGGLGFRRLMESNLALLSKQAWRVAFMTDSLLQNIIGQKYFPFSNFFEAELGLSLSFRWRSLLDARDILVNGLCWKDVGLIKSEFHPHDAECILGIDLCSSTERDELIWHYGKKGRFSLRSAYHAARLINGEIGASCIPPSWHFI
ncbi:UNVERIFIED_CONTAM: hypothetical protein Sradi_1588200, partial [Sesamum radiatum]